jgi:anti-sigma-K factor RskA
MDAEALHDLTAAYALHALDAEGARAYEEHLARCEQCRLELAELSEGATALAYAADGPAPPPALRERILTAARAERENVVPLRPRWALPAAVTAAAAVAAAVALAIWAVTLSDRLDRRNGQLRAQERAEAILADPAARRLPIAGGRGTLVVTPTGEGALVLARLQRAAGGKTYEAWVAQGGSPRPAGTFAGGGNVTTVALDEPVPDGATVMVTEERAGGARAPTQMPFVTVRNAPAA